MYRTENHIGTLKNSALRGGRLSSILTSNFFHKEVTSLLVVFALFGGVDSKGSTFVDTASLDSERDVASLRFPQVSPESDEDDIVKEYAPYFQFVTEIGKEVDAENTRRLVQVYQNLRKRSRSGAALFLKGLRYEMIQRVELSGWNPYALNTNSPEMRRFVGRYLSTWLREADEHLFRSYSNQIANRKKNDD